MKMKRIDIKKLVFIDESVVQNNITRNYGRVSGGQRLCEAVPGKTCDTRTIISSIRYDGSVAPMIVDLIEKAGAELSYLPPYSQDYNPREKMWSKIKSTLRKIKARTSLESNEAFTVAFNEITSSDAYGWFRSCGYVLIPS